jgi:hypothetical protein
MAANPANDSRGSLNRPRKRSHRVDGLHSAVCRSPCFWVADMQETRTGGRRSALSGASSRYARWQRHIPTAPSRDRRFGIGNHAFPILKRRRHWATARIPMESPAGPRRYGFPTATLVRLLLSSEIQVGARCGCAASH